MDCGRASGDRPGHRAAVSEAVGNGPDIMDLNDWNQWRGWGQVAGGFRQMGALGLGRIRSQEQEKVEISQ